MKNLLLIAATALIVGASSMATSAAELNTRQWLVALNASPITAVESPVLTAAAAWINSTPPAVGVMAYGAE